MPIRFSKKWIIWLITGAWLWMNGITALHYEPWHDIAQSWMIVRNLDLPGIFQQLSYEGHPCLWYMVLLPFVKLGAPFEAIFVISILLTLAALVLFLLYAPFRLSHKAIAAFSPLFMFYMPVAARSYALIPLLLMLVYLAYPTRLSHPVRYACILFLLCQVQVLLCGICGALMVLWSLDAWKALRRKQKEVTISACALSLGIMAAAVLFLYWQLKSSVGDNALVETAQLQSFAEFRHKLLWTLSLGSYYLFGGHFYDYGSTAWWLVLVPVILLAVCAGIWWLRRAPRSAGIFACSFVWQLAVHLFVYPQHRHHMLMLFWILLFCIMLALGELKASPKAVPSGKQLAGVLCTGLMVFCLLGYSYLYEEMQIECSPVKVNSFSTRVAEAIRTELPEDSVVIADAEYTATCVAAYLPDGKMYNPTRKNTSIHFIQDEQPMMWCKGDVSLDTPVQELRALGHTGAIYFLCDPSVEKRVQELSCISDVTLGDCMRFTGESKYEQYLLYRLEDEAADS